ncbi:DUF2087 domain-containing protein [Cellulomonas marina]|uniref:DUF2087 domain-containing protein n=1 Tax=Cellulomonas marina TaxID=988821 RepID=UPI000B7DEBD5|nr:DUF2087 domain-containing protein [Cellulomonas marina]GIG27849.1 hypothetical protein Cma02nite_04490 [Cellulomonas marina]
MPRDRDEIIADPLAPARPPVRFLVKGRVEALPRRRADKDQVLSWVVAQLVPVHDPVDERTLTDRLAGLVRDPVGIRRELVDAGLLRRTRDGAEYWRTLVTEYDAL